MACRVDHITHARGRSATRIRRHWKYECQSARPTNDISIELDQNVQRSGLKCALPIKTHFAHVTTVSLSWRVQHIVVIGWTNYKLKHFKFWSSFEFDRNIVSGTGPGRQKVKYMTPWSGNTLCNTDPFFGEICLNYAFTENIITINAIGFTCGFNTKQYPFGIFNVNFAF